MQAFLFLFSSPCSHAEPFILVNVTFLSCRICYSRSFHLPLSQKLLFLSISSSSHGEVVILVRFFFFPLKSCYSCFSQLSPMQNCYFCSFHLPSMLKFSFLFLSISWNTEVVIILHLTFP